MAVIEINVRDQVDQVQVVNLEEKTYRIRLNYNSRTLAWTIGILDRAGNVLIEGSKCVANWNPFKAILVANLPEGRIIIFDRSGTGDTPGRDSLGFDKDAGLLYETSV